MQTHDLKEMREWAAQRIGSQAETPWDWYQLMKLREALDALIGSAESAATLQTEDLPEQRERQEKRLQLAVDNSPRDNAPPHR